MNEKNSMSELNEALAAISKALEPLSEESRKRVLRWAGEYFGEIIGAESRVSREDRGPAGSMQEYGDVADLFAAARPKTQAEKALVVAYWAQVVGENATFGGYQINSQLKDLGHGVGNITDVFNKLIRKSPQHIIQVKKAGTSKQARKLYKLTKAGIEEVEALVRGHAQEE